MDITTIERKDLPGYKEGVTFIYCLVDPESKCIRYVGKAVNLKNRHTAHHSPIRLGKDHKSNWIRLLINKGLKAEMALLAEVNTEAWEEAEKSWIKKLREEGHALTNGTDGGDGTSGIIITEAGIARRKAMRHSEEVKLRISLANKGNTRRLGKPRSSEEKEKQRASMKAFWSLPENKERMAEKRGAFQPSRSKDWIISYPDRTEVLVKSLKEFCRQERLDYSAFYRTTLGKNPKPYKDYLCKRP